MTPVPYPLTLGLHSQTDIVAAINDLNTRLSAIEASPWTPALMDRLDECERHMAWLRAADRHADPASYHPGIVLNPHGPPVVGNGAGRRLTAAPGSDAAADIEVLQAEIAALKTQLDQPNTKPTGHAPTENQSEQ